MIELSRQERTVIRIVGIALLLIGIHVGIDVWVRAMLVILGVILIIMS